MDEACHAPKKRKRNAERARVTRACDRCKRRKIKCDGVQPCEFCCRAEAVCTFDTAYARGRPPLIVPANGGLGTSGDASVSHNGSNAMPAQRIAVELPDYAAHSDNHQPVDLSSFTSPSNLTAASKSPHSTHTGLHGEYIGPASGVSFLQRVQKRLGQSTSFSHPDSIFTFGDAPFASVDADLSFCMMIPRDIAQKLVDRYFDFAMPTYRFLHRPTIQAWFVEFYDTFGMMHDTQRAPAKVALVLMVLAHGRVYMPDREQLGPPNLSHRLYSVAEQQLAKESGPIRLASVQARLTQCYYLLTQSRVNHCWRTFGTVSQLSLATGLNRKTRSSTISVELECRRRTFWCAYTLDVHLSVVLGRPQLFHDEDIDVELPTDIEDDKLIETQHAASGTSTGLSTMLAPLAHMNLARIVKRILRQLNPLKPITASHRSELTAKISDSLSEWRSNLSSFLETENFSASLFLPIVQRQRNVLNLTYWHAVILTHRPFLLNNFGENGQLRDVSDDSLVDKCQVERSVQQCLQSAIKTVEIISQITQSGQMYRAFWIAAYFAFTASTVLYIYVIQRRTSPPEVYIEYLSAAIQCQSQISSIAEKGSLLDRYCVLLEELRLESIRKTDQHRFLAADPSVAVRSPVAADVLAGQYLDESFARNPSSDSNNNLNTAIPDQMSDFADWDQFASMVSSGLGNLDAFLNADLFDGTGEFASMQ